MAAGVSMLRREPCRLFWMLYRELGRPEDAEAMLLAAREMALATKSEEHRDVLGARTNLGGLVPKR